MPKRSRAGKPQVPPLVGRFAPIRLPEAFPVSPVNQDLRSDVPPIPPHVHDCFELGYCHKGNGVFLVADKVMSFRGGDAVVINNREMHIVKSSPGELSQWSFLNLDPVRLLAGYCGETERLIETDSLSGPEFSNILSGQTHPALTACIREIVEEVLERKTGYRSLVRALVWNLLVRLHRVKPAATAAKNKKKLADTFSANAAQIDRVRPAIEAIAESFHQPTRPVSELAALCCCSESNFRKLFGKALGCSPCDYVKKLRLQAASTLLQNTSRPILDIAVSCGYDTLSNFNRQFLAAYGMSPRARRNQSPSR